jgi:hypothetical protein
MVRVTLAIMAPKRRARLSAIAAPFAVVGGVAGAAFVACTSTVLPPIDNEGPGGTPREGGAVVDAATVPEAATVVSCHGADGGCNDLLLCGKQVNVVELSQTSPTAMGGTIVPGVYSMTAYRIFTGAGGANTTPGNWFKETFEILPGATTGPDLDASSDGAAEGGAEAGTGSGTGMGTYPWSDLVQSDQGSPSRNGGEIVTQGTSLVFQFDCASTSSFPTDYTATATTITTYYSDPGIGQAEVTYSLQP